MPRHSLFSLELEREVEYLVSFLHVTYLPEESGGVGGRLQRPSTTVGVRTQKPS